MDKNLGEKIIALREKGFSYNKIAKKLNCAKSTISYHCGIGQKVKYEISRIKRREIKNKSQKNHFDYIRKLIWRHKKFVGCISCSEKDPVALDYDHREKDEKILAVSVLLKNRVSVEVIKNEIRKCDVRCSNCHRKKTAKDRGYYKDL